MRTGGPFPMFFQATPFDLTGILAYYPFEKDAKNNVYSVAFDTTDKVFGDSSADFPAVTGYERLLVTDAPEFDLNKEESWTVDFRINKPGDSSTWGAVFHRGLPSSPFTGYFCGFKHGSNYFMMGNAANGESGIATTEKISYNVWHHIAIVFDKTGNTLKIYIDGIVKASGTSTNIDWGNARQVLTICAQQGSLTDRTVHAKIDEFRFSKGIARWTDEFTPPSAAYTTDEYTKLLLHFDNSFADTSLSRRNSQYPPLYNSTYVKATSYYNSDPSYIHYNAVNPANSLTGEWGSAAWLAGNGVTTNQRFHIDLGCAKVIERVYYENVQRVGTMSDAGAKNFTFWGSNSSSSFDETTYATDTGWTQLTCDISQLVQHCSTDTMDPKFINVTNSTAYRYYAFKFADNWGGGFLGVRRIELQTNPAVGRITTCVNYYDGTTYGSPQLKGDTPQYPPAYSDTYSKATSNLDSGWHQYNALDPSKSLTGDWGACSWLSNSGTTPQRFHIDLGSSKVIKNIYYENAHASGGWESAGVQNFTFWGSNSSTSFDEMAWGDDTGWTQLETSQSTFDQHVHSDVADPKYIAVNNSTAYRYYAFKFADCYGATGFMGVRRIELQTGQLGKYGNCYDYITAGSKYILTSLYSSALTTAHTIAFWMNPDTASSGIFQIANGVNDGNPAVLCWRLNATTVRWNLNADARIHNTVSNTEWTHMALTWDGTTWTVYKNGVADGTYVGGWAGRTGYFYIGCGYPNYFQGKLDEVVVFNRALTENEIVALMALTNVNPTFAQ